MRAAMLTAPYELTIKEVPMPTAGPGEVVIRVKYMGICGSDVPIYEGKVKAELPIIPGHEFAGIVHEIGAGVTNYHVGQVVSAQAAWGCGVCKNCMEGRKDLCQHRQLLGSNVNGALAEYIKIPSAAVIPLSDSVNLKDAQSLSSLACCVNGVERLAPEFGSVGVLFGTGHSGLLMIEALKYTAVSRLAVVGGKRKFRMDMAAKLGADMVCTQQSADYQKKMQDFLPPEGADFVVESSGNPAALVEAVRLVKSGGTILTYGMYKSAPPDFDFSMLYKKELTIKGVKGSGGCDLKALSMLASGKADIESLITHTLSLDECNEGFQMMSKRQADALRIVFAL